MSFEGNVGGLVPPPAHPSAKNSPLPSPGLRDTDFAGPPPLPPRPTGSSVSLAVADEDSDSETNEDERPSAVLGASTSTVNLLSSKDEEALSEIQLRELYDDEEIDRFLHLFSTYVREVRATDSVSSTDVALAASASAPALSETLSPDRTGQSPEKTRASFAQNRNRPLSERVAVDFFLPLLPPPRPPPPEFSIGRLKQTAQRLYVALEPVYSQIGLPLLKLATWQDPKRSFAYCAAYWLCWYHGLLLSALLLRLLYELVRRKIHPYPSLEELRAHRSRIDRAHTFGTVLSTRLLASPALGVRDMWGIFRDYRHTRKAKKAAKEKVGRHASDPGLDDSASIHSDATENPDSSHESPLEDVAEEDLKRLGLFLLNEVADVLERLKNIFLWRNPGASVFYGAVVSGWFVLGLLPSKYVVRFVGMLVGGFFWHVIPVVAAIPPSERSRIPPPLSRVPTDTEYAMELISQRVARGLPVRPKRRRHRPHSSASSVAQTPSGHHEHSSSSAVDWNKWGDRLTSAKERTGDIKKTLGDGQWKQSESWKALNPLLSKVVAPQRGPEPRIETHTFPAQLKQHPGLITLTPTTIFFTPLLSSHAAFSVTLTDVTGVKKSSLMKGIDIYYAAPRPDGTREEKAAKFLFVGSRDDLFARLVSYGGKRWAKV